MATEVALEAVREQLLALDPAARERMVRGLPAREALALLYDWRFWARPPQLPPEGDWTTWILRGGRGAGKTRSGAEWVIERSREGQVRIALLARNPADARRVMIEGESGILACSPPWHMPIYNSTLGTLSWPNGAQAFTYSAEVPDSMRGPQHHYGWVDELCKFRFPRDAWDQYQFGLRLGAHPRTVVTTTPRASVAVWREILAEAGTVVARETTYANRDNLAPSFFRYVVEKYEGTTLGRQELLAEDIGQVDGALWQRAWIDRDRVREAPPLRRICLGVDPAVSSNADAAETGIVLVGMGEDRHLYVLDDQSAAGAVNRHAARIVSLGLSRADFVVGEVNNGGELVEATLRGVSDEDGRATGQALAYRAVRASRGKVTRAEPIALLSEQRRMHLVGILPELEDQLCTWRPGDRSPDRLDAMVWAATALIGEAGAEPRIRRLV